MRIVPFVPLLAMTAVLLAGCSAPAGMSGPEASTPQTLDEFKSAYLSAGGPCRVWTEDDDIRDAAQSGTCGNGITLSTYLDGADLLDEVKVLRDTASGGDDGSGDPPRTELLIGSNWLVSGPHVRRLQSKLGGRLAVINPAASN